MRIAAHTIAFPDADLDTAVAACSAMGFDGLEILIDADYPCAVAPRSAASRLATVRRLLDAAGLPCVEVGPYVRTLDDLDDATRAVALEDAEDAIRIAAALGAGGVRMLAGRRDDLLPERRRERFLSSLRRLAAAADAAGVRLDIETKGWSFAYDAVATANLVDEVDRTVVGVLLDPANLVMDGVDPVATVTLLGERVHHVHAKDVRRSAAGWFPCRAGDGVVPWSAVFGALRGAGYGGDVSLEYERRWHPASLPAAPAGTAHELAWFRAAATIGPEGLR